MAALPFLITSATVAYVALFPPDEGRIDSSKALSLSSRISLYGSSVLNSSFFLGIGVGVSLSWLTSYEVKRRRLWQRVRLKLLSWLHRSNVDRDSDKGEITPLLHKYRKPFRLTELSGTPIPRKTESDKSSDGMHGSHLEVVSPDWAMSSNLYCDVLTLPPGTELVSRDAEGVEFYYVVKGDGIYVDRNGEEHQISAEYGFIVDPECNRGFLVGGKTEGLVLLRATDIVVSGANSHLTKLQASSLSSTVAMFKAGVNKVYQLIGKETPA